MSRRFAFLIPLFLFRAAVPAQTTAGGEGIVSVRSEAAALPEVASRMAAAEAPALLQGVWQGSDRLVMFSNDGEFALVLRVFYQWYGDRAAESASFSELRARDRNNTTKSPAEDIRIQYVTVVENPSRTAGVYELSVSYPREKSPVLIPVCVMDGRIYLDFLIKDSAQVTDLRFSSGQERRDPQDGAGGRDGFYRAASSAGGITIAAPVFQKEVLSYFVGGDGTEVYKIRYWLSEMDYSYAKATFSDGDKVFTVDKYLRIGSDVYQCTTGRSTKIRNIQKSSQFDKPAVYDSDGGIVAFGEPYLVRVPGAGDRESLLASVAEGNSRRKPAPAPLFPPSFPKFRWREITELERYNPSTWSRRNLDIHK